MDALARSLCRLARWWCRALQRRGRPPLVVRAALAALGLVAYSWIAPPLWLLHRLGARLGGEADAHFGARFDCDAADLIQGYIYFFGVWEPDVSAYLQRALRPGDTVVDVGANVGYDTLLAASLVGERGRVVAIEASPAIHGRLEANLALNGLPPQVRTVQAAAAGDEGTLTVHRGPGSNLGQTTTAGHLGRPVEAEVRAAPLGALVDRDELASARVIKIDVEGTEREILAGLVPELDRLAPEAELVVELSPGLWPTPSPDAGQVLAPFVERGFQVYRVPNSYWFWHALWPDAAHPPRRVRGPLDPAARQLDLVLSRRDAETL